MALFIGDRFICKSQVRVSWKGWEQGDKEEKNVNSAGNVGFPLGGGGVEGSPRFLQRVFPFWHLNPIKGCHGHSRPRAPVAPRSY